MYEIWSLDFCQLLAIFYSNQSSLQGTILSSNFLIELQPVQEETQKDITDKDVEMGFDISRTKHKGQVYMHRLAYTMKILIM
jgi:thioredoxin reductase (NADPH)